MLFHLDSFKMHTLIQRCLLWWSILLLLISDINTTFTCGKCLSIFHIFRRTWPDFAFTWRTRKRGESQLRQRLHACVIIAISTADHTACAAFLCIIPKSHKTSFIIKLHNSYIFIRVPFCCKPFNPAIPPAIQMHLLEWPFSISLTSEDWLTHQYFIHQKHLVSVMYCTDT